MLSLLSLLAVPAVVSPARAEGYSDFGGQVLKASTDIYVDIVDPTAESIRFEGVGQARVSDPLGNAAGTFRSGDEIPTPTAGAWKLELTADQKEVAWDISVVGQVDDGGRVYSYNWFMNALEYGEASAFTGSFYALADGGGEGYDGIVELKMEGLAGYEWSMSANPTGVEGEDAGRSVQTVGNTYQPDYPIYLRPPTVANDIVLEPDVENVQIFGEGRVPCTTASPGSLAVTFRFETNVEGTYHLVCDIDQDGLYELNNNEDVALSGAAVPGDNTIEWDGYDNAGNPVPDGSYQCVISVAVGEFHYIADDIETSFPGLRIFQILEGGTRLPLHMFWNDGLVQDDNDAMPDGEVSLSTSPYEGMNAGIYEDETLANVNARAWGNFTEESKGNAAYLDTFTWLENTTSEPVTVDVVGPDVDTDGDGFTDIAEICQMGSDPYAIEGHFQGGGCQTGGGYAGAGALALALAGLAGVRRRSR